MYMIDFRNLLNHRKCRDHYTYWIESILLLFICNANDDEMYIYFETHVLRMQTMQNANLQVISTLFTCMQSNYE